MFPTVVDVQENDVLHRPGWVGPLAEIDPATERPVADITPDALMPLDEIRPFTASPANVGDDVEANP